jgi:pimeloyl-ACP methyl ester carboxylesterase
MGGYILFEIWRRAPERVGALILCDTKAEADSPEARAGREASIELVRGGRRAELTRGMLPRLLARSSRSGPEPVGLVTEMMQDASEAGIIAALEALRDRPDARPTLETIRVPTLILVGAEDEMTPPSLARAMGAAIPGSEVVEIPHAGHLAPLENPEAINQAVQSFLAGPAP